MPTQTFDGIVYEDGQQFKDDARLMVRFSMKPIPHEFRSKEEGRPIFIDVPYIEVITPGSRDTLVTEATEVYQHRFRKQWEAFLARAEAPMEGTPLSEVPWLTASQVAELNAMNVKTVEQLVNLPDVLAQKVMGSSQLRTRARRFLDAANGEAVTAKLDNEIRTRDDVIRNMKMQMDDMAAQLASLTKSQAPKQIASKV